jgi:glutathione S-transferase
MSDVIEFYTNPHSRGRIVRWMLEEIGEPYETTIIEYGPAMKAPEYLAINPMGKVPAIVHRGTVVTECAAICAYLADAFPLAGLAPAPKDRADYYRWLFFAAGPLEAAVTDRTLGVEVSDDQRGMVGYGDLETALATLEKGIASRPYIAGDSFSAADVYVGSQVIWGMQFKTLESSPVFQAYAERLRTRDAYRRAGDLDGPME